MPEYSLRKITENDAEWLVNLHNDPEVLMNVTDPTPITIESHNQWFQKIQLSKNQERYIFCVDGVDVGFSKFYSIDRCNKNLVLGADIHKDHRGKGYAKHMWNLMLNKCFSDDIHMVSLTTAEYNKLAIRIYEKLGFKFCGVIHESLFRNNKFYDQHVMYMTKEMWEKR